MIYLLSADLVLLIHLGWILFTLFGSILAWRYLWMKRIQTTMMVYGVFIEIFRWICPLTYLENWLLRQSNPSSTYQGDFISHYLGKIIYIQLSQGWLIAGAILVLLLNLWFYSRKEESSKK